MQPLDILYEDNHLLVINKPAGIATMGAESGPTIHSMAADYLKRTYNKPGRAFVGIVSRLDTVTSGVLVLARTSKAASRLSAQLADKSGSGARRIYLAGVAGRLESQRGRWTDHVRKDDAARRMRVVTDGEKDSQRAMLRFQQLGHNDDVTIIAVELLTGRKHQIRVQLSAHGHPVIGDRKYGSTRPFSSGVALHSWRLQIMHPTRRQPMWFTADPPRSWKSLQRIMPPQRKWQDLCTNFLDSSAKDDRE